MFDKLFKDPRIPAYVAQLTAERETAIANLAKEFNLPTAVVSKIYSEASAAVGSGQLAADQFIPTVKNLLAQVKKLTGGGSSTSNSHPDSPGSSAPPPPTTGGSGGSGGTTGGGENSNTMLYLGFAAAAIAILALKKDKKKTGTALSGLPARKAKTQRAKLKKRKN